VTPVADGLPMPQRLWAVVTLFVGIGISVLEGSMVNVALPDIALSLNTSAAAAVWVVNGFGLTVAVTLLPFAAMAERVGFKRVFRIGLTLFVLGAIASALAPNLELLLFSRVIHGLGASAIMCLFGGLLRHIYPMRLLSRGIALNAVVVSVASVIGPTVASLILTVADWRWMFVSMVPLAFVAFFTMRALPEVARVERRFDYSAAVLSAIAIGFFIVGLDYLATYPLVAAVSIAISVFMAIGLVRRSLQQTAPLVPVDLLRIDAIRAALAASVSAFGAQMAAFVSLPFYFLLTLERDALEVGILMAAWPLGATMMAPIAGRLADRYPVAVLCAVGAGAMLSGSLWIVLLGSDPNDVWLFAAMVLGGVGFGFFQTPNNRALLGSAPRERASAVGGLQAVTRVIGQTAGAALVAMAFTLGDSNELSNAINGLIVSVVLAAIALAINVRRQWRSMHGADRDKARPS